MRHSILLIVIGIAGLSGSCSNPFYPEMENGGLDAGQFSTENAALRSYELAYTTKDLDLYEQCLADDFTFVFNPEDRIFLEEMGIKEAFWGKTEEIRNVKNIFQDAETITLSMISTRPVDISGNGTAYMFRQTINLTVTLTGQIYTVYGEALFTVKKIDLDHWKIVQITDLTRGS